jgi:site-specific recombinase XerD
MSRGRREVGVMAGVVSVRPSRAAAIAAETLAQVPALYAPSPKAAKRFLEYFAANIRNRNTRIAYFHAVTQFAAWCDANGVPELVDLEPVHVAAYVEQLQTRLAKPSVKQHLAAIRQLLDWLVVGQVIATNPAAPVRGPKHSVKKGKTAVLTAEETRTLLDSIPADTLIGKRDRALIATMTYTFARIGAVLKMRVEDVYVQGRRTWLRLHEKGGKRHEMPAHHLLDEYLNDYLTTAGLEGDRKGYLFRTCRGRSDEITENPLAQPDAYRMIRRRALAAGIRTRIGNHTFRATGITEYLRNGGKLEIAQRMANHESARTTGLYDRRDDSVSLDEVERILI